MALYRVIYAAGAFLDNFHYAEGEIVDYTPEGKDDKVLWGVPCDAQGNDLVEGDTEAKAKDVPNQRIANTVGKVNDTKEADAAEVKRRAEEIKQATTLLDSKNDDHWTQGGEARMETLEAILGYNVTRKELDAAVPDFKRQTQA